VPAIKLARLQHNSRSWCTAHIEQSIALYDPQQHRSLAFLYGGDDPRVSYLYHTARNLWFIGYPEQALGRIPEALTLAQELSYPPILATALGAAAMVHQHRREGQLTQERAEALVALSSEHGFPEWLAAGTIGRGWALAEQGQGEEGITQIHQGLDA
jgi:adenylate cyclase